LAPNEPHHRWRYNIIFSPFYPPPPFTTDLGVVDEGVPVTDDDYVGAGGDVGAAASKAALRFASLREAVAAVEEYSTERRSARREAALRRLFRCLALCATTPAAWELVSTERETIRRAAASHGLLRASAGQPAEQYAACRVLEAASVVLGAGEEEWCESLSEPLRRVATSPRRAAPVRMAALRALSMSVFIGAAQDAVMLESLMDLCEQLAAGSYRTESKVPPALRATALDCWALLATAVDDFYLAAGGGSGEEDEEEDAGIGAQLGRGVALLPLLKEALDQTESQDLRAAAGECIALIHEARLNLGLLTTSAAAVGGDGEEQQENSNITARQFRGGSWDGSPWEVLMDEVGQRVAELAVESDRRMSKKARREQRATFREFAATIVDDEAPAAEVVQLGRNRAPLELCSWREIIRLNFVRHCLQGGFQIQLLTNPTLQAIFGIDSSLSAGMSRTEKRLIMSKGSEAAKAADRHMTRKRDKRQAVKNHFLTADGEDI
jgi:hypothetical protein